MAMVGFGKKVLNLVLLLSCRITTLLFSYSIMTSNRACMEASGSALLFRAAPTSFMSLRLMNVGEQPCSAHEKLATSLITYMRYRTGVCGVLSLNSLQIN